MDMSGLNILRVQITGSGEIRTLVSGINIRNDESEGAHALKMSERVPLRLVFKTLDKLLGIDGHIIHANLIEGVLEVLLDIVETHEDESEQ